MNAVTGLRYALVIDDHPLVCKGLCEFVRSLRLVDEVVGLTAENELPAVLTGRGAPVLVLLDFWLQSGASGEIVRQLSQLSPQPRIVVMSGDDRPGVTLQARRAGAHGFVGKRDDPVQLADAIDLVMSGLVAFPSDLPASDWAAIASASSSATSLSLPVSELGLTLRQGQVLQLILQGHPNKQIALQLNLSENTVKEYVSEVLLRLGVASRVEAITKLSGYKLMLS
jgi:DNA-binding NarL/FixJ family response regulator